MNRFDVAAWIGKGFAIAILVVLMSVICWAIYDLYLVFGGPR